MRRLKIAVIGAGMGGLSAAAHLTARGYSVTVYERSGRVGGKAGRAVVEGFRFDTGPTLLTLPDIVRRAFRAVDGDLDRDVGLLSFAPVCRYFFPGGRVLDVTDDPRQAAINVDALFPGEGEGYARFMRHAATIWNYASEPYLEAPFTSYPEFIARVLRRGIGAFKLGGTLGTLDGLAREFFRAPELRAFVGRFATYVGGDPSRSTAAYANIAHCEMALGAMHPKGGMAAIADALASRLRAKGVEIHCDTAIDRVELSGQRAVAVHPRGRGRSAVDAVVANVDPQVVCETMLPTDAAERVGLRALRARERSVSGYALLLGVEGSVGSLAHHNIYFPSDYPREFVELFSQKRALSEPTLYVNVPGLTESEGVAPKGCQSLYVLVNAPATGDRAEVWRDSSALDAAIVARLEEIVPGIGARVRVRSRVTPADIAALGNVGGAIYGEAPHGKTAPFRRPKQRAEGVRGLYWVGGSVHPGGGVPMVTLGGEHAAALIAQDARSV